MEGDLYGFWLVTIREPDFNPLPPHGGRPAVLDELNEAKEFQSTPSAWRETLGDALKDAGSDAFQSTPSAWRETSARDKRAVEEAHFNPLPPHGGRPSWQEGRWDRRFYFNPLPPHGGRPFDNIIRQHKLFISIHSLRMEGDPILILLGQPLLYFNPLPPHGGRPYV